MDEQEQRVRAYIDKVGAECYTLECMVAHLTDVEFKRVLLNLPRPARECLERVIDEAEPG